MKSLNAKIAAGLIVGALGTQGALAQDAEQPDVITGNGAAEIAVTEPAAAALTQACTLYRNILDLADTGHFNGALVDPDHAAMAEASLREMVRQVYIAEFYDPVTDTYDESVVTFRDDAHTSISDDGAEIASLSFPDSGQTVNLTEAPDTMTSYGAHCAYLQEPATTISAITGQTPLELYELAVDGALSETRDPHTRYLPPADAEDMVMQTKGSFGGFGVTLNMVKGEVTIDTVTEDGPGDKAGIEAGDVIMKADGQPFLGMTLRETVNILRGPVGSDVNLTIRRGADIFDVPVTRDIIKIEAAEARILDSDPSTIQLKIKNFSRPLPQEAYDKVREQLQSVTSDDPAIKNIVVDVRNNPGGSLYAALALTDLFMGDDGVGGRERIVGVGRNADEKIFYATPSNPFIDFTGYNILVLQNQGSASASEILAGALQDAGHEVIGANSFGKGSVQTLTPTTIEGLKVPFGSNKNVHGRLKLTIAAFFPGDTKLSNQGSGIISNVQVQFNDIRDELNREALREADLEHTLISESATRAGQIPANICSLKEKFAGPLADDKVAALPEDLIRKRPIRNEETDKFELKSFFDADLHCATMRANGQDQTDYALIYSRPAP